MAADWAAAGSEGAGWAVVGLVAEGWAAAEAAAAEAVAAVPVARDRHLNAAQEEAEAAIAAAVGVVEVASGLEVAADLVGVSVAVQEAVSAAAPAVAMTNAAAQECRCKSNTLRTCAHKSPSRSCCSSTLRSMNRQHCFPSRKDRPADGRRRCREVMAPSNLPASGPPPRSSRAGWWRSPPAHGGSTAMRIA